MMNEPVFTSELETQYVNLNANVKLKCSLNQAVTDVEWFRGRKQLTPITVTNNETKMDHYYEIESMSKDDEGTYICMYKSAMTCCYLFLKVSELTFTSPLKDDCVKLNTTVKLKCSLNEAVEHVQWFKGRKQLVNNMTDEKKEEHCYEIKNMSEVDVGTYVCRYESAVTCCYLSLSNGKMETSQVELSDAELKERLRKANKEIRDLKAFTGILEEEKTFLEIKISQIQINFDKNKDKNEELERCLLQLSNVQNQMKTLETEINQIKAESLDFENKLAISDQAYEKAVKSQRQTEFESKTILEGIKEAKRGQATEIKDSVEQEMRSMFEEFEKKMDNRIQSLEAKKLNAEQEKKEAIQHEKMNALKNELDAAEHQKIEAVSEKENAKKVVETKDGEINAMNAKLTALKDELDAAEYQKTEAVSEKENAKKVVETKDGEINAMNAKLAEFTAEMRGKSNKLKKEKQQAENQISTALKERENAKIEVENANDKIREMETRIKELEEKKKDCCIL